ncbi:MAG TPA: Clp protease N-terminal domain-containing protein, partial [Ktedonobacteraceae bacterium]
MNNLPLFDKFTERARKVVSLAQEEAQHFQHNAIGTEHLLLGLVREGESIAAQVLESLNVTPEKVRQAVEEAKGHGNAMVQGEIMLSPHANMAIEMAMKEAGRRFPFPSTNPEDRLLGSIQMPESDAVKILQDEKMSPHLESLGVTLEQVRKAVEEAKGRGNNMVQIQIETGMAPYAHKPETGDWHHPLIHIDTANLLLGLLRVPESTAVKILQNLGAPPLKDFWTLVSLEETTTLHTTNQGYVQRFTRQARKAWSLA